MAPLGAAVVLLALWAVLPWPLARWASACAAFFFVLAGVWSWLVSRSLSVAFDAHVTRTFSGRRVDIRTQVENGSPLPSGVLFIDDSSGGLETWGEPRRFIDLPAWTKLRLSYLVRGRERGEKFLGPLRISGCDPTGLFPFSLHAQQRSLIVYPPLRPVHGWPPGGLPSGNRLWEPALADDVSRFRTYRGFQAGDALSRLSAAEWARRGSPQVRVYDRTVERPTGVVVDLRASLYPLKLRWALLETAIETAASLVWESLGRGETVWLTVLDAEPVILGPGRGWTAARPFLERLALASPDKADTDTAPPLPPRPARLLWVGPREVSVAHYEVVRFVVEEGSHGAVTHPHLPA